MSFKSIFFNYHVLRIYENYGEDKYVATMMGTAYIDGAQGNSLKNNTKVITCLKHYIGYSTPLNGTVEYKIFN